MRQGTAKQSKVWSGKAKQVKGGESIIGHGNVRQDKAR